MDRRLKSLRSRLSEGNPLPCPVCGGELVHVVNPNGGEDGHPYDGIVCPMGCNLWEAYGY